MPFDLSFNLLELVWNQYGFGVGFLTVGSRSLFLLEFDDWLGWEFEFLFFRILDGTRN